MFMQNYLLRDFWIGVSRDVPMNAPGLAAKLGLLFCLSSNFRIQGSTCISISRDSFWLETFPDLNWKCLLHIQYPSPTRDDTLNPPGQGQGLDPFLEAAFTSGDCASACISAFRCLFCIGTFLDLF